MPKNVQTTCIVTLILHASKVMLKILQARLQHYMSWNFKVSKLDFRKGRGTRNQIANICWIIGKAREFQKHINLCFIDYTKAFDCVDHNKLWKIIKDMGMTDQLTCLLRNLYVGQETTVRTLHETMDWFKIGKEIWQGYKSSPCLLSLYSESIMTNDGLAESSTEINTARRQINNLRYADDTTLIAESEDELKHLLMKMKEESEKAGLKFNI